MLRNLWGRPLVYAGCPRPASVAARSESCKVRGADGASAADQGGLPYPGERFSVGGVRKQYRTLDERPIEFGEREDHLVTVRSPGQDVT